MPLVGDGLLDHDIGRGEGAFDVTALHNPVEALVVRRLLMHLRRIGVHCLPGIDNHRENVVVDVHGIRSIPGVGVGIGDDDGNGVTDVANGVDGNREVGWCHGIGIGDHPGARNTPKPGVCHFLAGEHPNDAWHLGCGRGVDPLDPGVSKRRSHHRHVHHARLGQVVGEAPLAGYEP